MTTLLEALTPLEQGPFSYSDTKGDGVQKTFTFSFYGPSPAYLRKSDIRPFLRDSDPSSPTYQSYSEIIFDDNNWTIDGTQITFTTAIETSLDNENNIRIRRIMPKDEAYTTAQVGEIFREEVIVNSFLQQLYSQHEVLDGFTESAKQNANIDMNNFKLVNLADGANPQDSVTKRQLDEVADAADATIEQAYKFANEAEDVPVNEAGYMGFSALHYAAKAEDQVILAGNERDGAEVAKNLAEAAEEQAGEYQDFANKWATEAEDVPVNDGENPVGFSAFHWATKAAGYVSTLLAQVVNLVAGPNSILAQGAAELPYGPEAQRPASSVPLIRGRTEDGKPEYYNPLTDEWGAVGGGGLTEPVETSENTHIAVKNIPLQVNVSDNVSRIVQIEAGWNVGDWLIVMLKGWTGDPSVTVKIDPDNSYDWEHQNINLAAGANLVIGGNQVVALQVTSTNKLKIVQGVGEQSKVLPAFISRTIDLTGWGRASAGEVVFQRHGNVVVMYLYLNAVLDAVATRTAIANIPEGFRPTIYHEFQSNVVDLDGTVLSRIGIEPSGPNANQVFNIDFNRSGGAGVFYRVSGSWVTNDALVSN